MRRRHWLIIVLLVTIGLVNSMDRATISIANLPIRNELGLSVVQMGWLLSAFLWAYAWSQLPLGPVLDRVASRATMGCAVLFWSVAQAFGGLSVGFGQIFASRLLLGVGEAPQLPITTKIVRYWFGPRDRGFPFAMFTGSLQLATALAAPLLTWIMLMSGWRTMFVVMGVAGLVSGSLWVIFYRDPSGVTLTPEEQAYLDEAKPTVAPKKMTPARWGRLLTLRTTWGVLLGFIGYNYLDVIYRFWLPAYLEMEHHLSIAFTGVMAAIPLTTAIIGSVCGGMFIDFLARRGFTPMMSARIPCILGNVVLAAATISLVSATNLPWVMVSLCFATWSGHMAGSAGWVLVTASVPHDSAASLGGLNGWVGNSAGAFSVLLTGYVVQATGSFGLALTIGLCVAIASALIYTFVPTKPIESTDLDGVSPATAAG
jgi:MFS family permease